MHFICCLEPIIEPDIILIIETLTSQVAIINPNNCNVFHLLHSIRFLMATYNPMNKPESSTQAQTTNPRFRHHNLDPTRSAYPPTPYSNASIPCKPTRPLEPAMPNPIYHPR
jgi:hypothetical protein